MVVAPVSWLGVSSPSQAMQTKPPVNRIADGTHHVEETATMARKHRNKPDISIPKYLKSHEVTDSFAYLSMSLAAKVLFDVLCKLRNRLRNSNEDDSFWRSDGQLILDSGLCRNALKRARHELISRGFLHWQSLLTDKHHEPRYYILDGLYNIGDDLDSLKKLYTHLPF